MSDPSGNCGICGQPLDDGRPVQTSLDGASSHSECVVEAQDDEGEDDA